MVHQYTKARAKELLLSFLAQSVLDGATKFYADALVGEDGDDEVTLRDLILRANGVKDVRGVGQLIDRRI